MRISRIGAAGAATIAASALVLSACAAPQQESEVVEGSSITVAWNQPFYSYNSNTSFGNATANANIVYMTSGAFNYYDNTPELQKDESFGTYEVVSEDPLVVEYMSRDGKLAEFYERLSPLLDFLIPEYISEGKAHLSVAIGCTGGRHRSVAIAEALGERLRARDDVEVDVTHRDVGLSTR